MASPVLERHPVIDAKFLLIRRLVSGRGRTVYEAEDLRSRERLALELLPAEWVGDPDAAQAFLREARAAASLAHPNVAQIHDVGIDAAGQPYLASGLLDGETLDEVLDERGALSVESACAIMLQVLQALDAAHAVGILHRALTPANVMVDASSPGPPRVEVLGFGMAAAGSSRTCRDDAFRLTTSPLYMSPERALGTDQDERSDVYSAGVMLYELLTGQHPFEVTTVEELLVATLRDRFVPLRQRNARVPMALTAAVHAAMAGNRSERLASAAELAARIAPFASGRPASPSASETRVVARLPAPHDGPRCPPPAVSDVERPAPSVPPPSAPPPEAAPPSRPVRLLPSALWMGAIGFGLGSAVMCALGLV